MKYKILFIVLCATFALFPAKAAVDFAALRMKWYNHITGHPYSLENENIKSRVEGISSGGESLWTSFLSIEPTNHLLWNDLTYTSASHLTETTDRLKKMADAYCALGSLHKNATLKADIIKGLDRFYKHWYNETVPANGNWWDFMIGTPLNLNDIVIMMYEELTTKQRTDYMKAVAYYTPGVAHYTSCNLTWILSVIAVRAIILEDTSLMEYVQANLPPAFQYVTTGDGFYSDGSFIQHEKQAYNGGYGASMLSNLSDLWMLLDGTPWKFSESQRQRVLDYVYNSFEPLIYDEFMMAMVRGREVSRSSSFDYKRGRNVSNTLQDISALVGREEAKRLGGIVKRWRNANPTVSDVYQYVYSIRNIKQTTQLMNDASIPERTHYAIYRQFAGMDRAVIQRPGYAFGVSMHSSRMYNYEVTNNENLKGWHQADGMTLLYTEDQVAPYDGHFWPTVNAYRMQGTTVEENTTYVAKKSNTKSWVGGVSMLDTYGTTGMYLNQSGTTMEAKKSWFMFDNEIVALGAGIFNKDNKNVSTYIEQRRLAADNRNVFFVDGTKMGALFGSEADPMVLSGVKWAHLGGKYTGRGDIGYYFPTPGLIKALRQEQSGKWKDINHSGDETVRTNYFLTLWKEHGNHAEDCDADHNRYAYVLLPGMTRNQTSTYAGSPDIEIISNTSTIQAVKENNLQLIAANFWNNTSSNAIAVDGVANYLTCNKKASVMVWEKPDSIIVSVSDPTMSQTDTIVINLKTGGAVNVLYADESVKSIDLSAGIKIEVDAKGLYGATSQVILSRDQHTSTKDKTRIKEEILFRIKQSPDLSFIDCLIESDQDGVAALTCRDLHGRVLKKIELPVYKGMSENSISVSHPSRGIYFSTLQFRNQCITKKYIK